MTDRGCDGCRNADANNFAIPFTMAFQPIVDVEAGTIWGYESLVRGIAGESAFQVLSQLTPENRYAFDQACRVKAIELAGAKLADPTAKLSINFLPNAVYRPQMCIRSTLESARAHGFPLERLIFEAVEGEHVESNKHLMNILREYREFGFKTAIDDFGAGYSGLNLLADFQPDLIKLDMALIRDIHRDRVRQTIVRNVVNMCRELDVEVIAEGIEVAEERDFLADCGIYLMQGYWFARPAFKSLAQIPTSAWLKR